MKKLLFLLPVLILATGCVKRALVNRDIVRVKMGPSVDENTSRLISSSKEVLPICEGLDPILAAEGFELISRYKSSGDLSLMGAAYSSDYILEDESLPGVVRCFVDIDMDNIAVAFEIGPSSPWLDDYPSIEAVRQNISELVQRITEYFNEHCPDRAIEISHIQWPPVNNVDVEEYQSGSYPQGPWQLYVFGTLCIAGMHYYCGKEYPKWVRDYYLLGTIGMSMAPEDSSGYGPARDAFVPWTLMMAGINHYYIHHPERPKNEAGWANVAGYLGGGLVAALVSVLMMDTEESRGDPVIIPYTNPHKTGLILIFCF